MKTPSLDRVAEAWWCNKV